jgi:hypothetical protein
MRRLIAESVKGLYQMPLKQKNAIARPDSRMQFPSIERFGKVIVRSCIKSLNHVPLLIFSRYEQNILIPIDFSRPDAAAKFDAIDSRHHPVQDEQVWSHFTLQQFPGLAAILNGNHVVAPALQSCLQNSPEDRIIFRNQYLPARGIICFNAAQNSKFFSV